ncbi:hypothetical protein [Pseudarthrobacter sp. YAF2]|uniref:hypothetical protein n=1 Tax=Pseudarthrobacter sp. YAF2 TaxID=3233078 RepID=UPI003F9ABEFD
MIDVLNVSFSGSTYIAASIGLRTASDASISLAIVLVVGTWILFSLGAEFASKGALPVIGEEAQTVGPRIHFLPYLLLASIFGGVVFLKILSVGISATLELRQSVFSDNFLILLGYFVLPVLVALGVASAAATRGTLAFAYWLTSGALLVVTALMGSRSGLFLGAVIPALAYFWKRILASKKSVKRDFQRLVVVVSVIAIPLLGGSLYLASTRGLVETSSVLDGTDVSQADVLVDLIESQAGGVAEGSTYMASVASFIPRNVWSAKPLPGNVVSSEVLTPERYFLTGAETTAGLLGEAYINVGWAAPLVAALLMLVLLRVCSLFLRSSDHIVWMVGLILVIRGLNLLRGDLTNVVVPAISAVLVWWIVCKKASPAHSNPKIG